MPAAIQGKKAVKNYYKNKEVASKYISQRYSSLFGRFEHEAECKAINQMLKKLKPEKLLDIAIGTGRVAQCLKYYKQGYGIDASCEMLDVAKKHLKGWILKESDAFAMRIEDQFFNVIVSTRFLWHFNRKERRALFAEMHKKLEEGGFLVFDAPNAEVKRFVPLKAKIGRKRVYTHLWTLSSLKKELKENKFELIEFKPVLKNALLIHKISDKTNSVFGYWIMKLIDLFSRKEPYAFLALAKKN